MLIFMIIIQFNGFMHLRDRDRFNKTLFTTESTETGAATAMTIGPRGGSTDSWEKKMTDSSGTEIKFQGITMDAVLVNNSEYKVQDWELTVNITQDCYINNGWCGVFEIYQTDANGRETVQELDLRNFNIADVKLENIYDGDILIRLRAGDKLVYHPSAADHENEIAAGGSMTVGMIFYYLDSLELNDYRIDYHYHKPYLGGAELYIYIIAMTIWCALLIAYIVAIWAYNNAQKTMELQKSSISAISEIYNAVYIIDLYAGDVTTIREEDKYVRNRSKKSDAGAEMRDMVHRFCHEDYEESMLKFVDLDTLPKRLDVKESIRKEYLGKNGNWYEMRFFEMGRDADRTLNKAICSVQDINAEKEEMKQLQLQAEDAARDHQIKGAYMVQEIKGLNECMERAAAAACVITEKSGSEELKELSRDQLKRLDCLTKRMGGFVKCAEHIRGEYVPEFKEYSLKELLGYVIDVTEPERRESGLELKTNINDRLHDRLKGDVESISQILVSLLMNAAEYGRKVGGEIDLTVFGKELEGSLHLLISVKNIGGNADRQAAAEEAAVSGSEEMKMDVTDMEGSLAIIGRMLSIMGSELKTANGIGEERECYFEIEQTKAGG